MAIFYDYSLTDTNCGFSFNIYGRSGLSLKCISELLFAFRKTESLFGNIFRVETSFRYQKKSLFLRNKINSKGT